MHKKVQGKSREKSQGQHFLLSKEVRDFTLWDVAQMSEDECFWKFVELRWGSRHDVVCPSCSVIDSTFARLDRKQLRCKHCDHHFSPLVNSPFADRKMKFKKLLMAFSLYTASAKGVPALFMCRLLDMQDKTATALTGKLREVLLTERDDELLTGVIHMDGGYFCGKPRKSNFRLKSSPEDKQAAIQARLKGETFPNKKPRNKNDARNFAKRMKLRRVVMVLREVHPEKGRGAVKTRVAIAYSENASVATKLAKTLVQEKATIWTDENVAYNVLSTWYDHEAVEHAQEFVRWDGVNENQAESFFTRMRRAEYGTFHGYRPKYLMDYAQEFAWREDKRQDTEHEKLKDLMGRIFNTGLSKWWRGYWQGVNRAGEYEVVT